uniref:Integrase catalytic domain-containing protein n=1 Tax=Cyprinus carpio carpio TaxID=630221 RepID=A0A9J8A1W6_CYPCA
PAGLLQPLPIPQRPWSHIAIDFVTDLPSSNSFTTILTIIDHFSKSCRLVPLPKLPTAFKTAEALLQNVFRFYNLPDIVSDRGPQFTSRVWRTICQQLNINVSLTSGYHPESNGQVERCNQKLTRFLRTYCHNNQADWSRYLLWAEYAQNSFRKPATGLTPFQCVLGFQYTLHMDPNVSDSSLHHPSSSKSHKTGAIHLCSICYVFFDLLMHKSRLNLTGLSSPHFSRNFSS